MYIQHNQREKAERAVRFVIDSLKLINHDKFSAGALSYILLRLLTEVFRTNPQPHMAQALLGLLQDVGLEFRHANLSPLYEEAASENGNIFDTLPSAAQAIVDMSKMTSTTTSVQQLAKAQDLMTPEAAAEVLNSMIQCQNANKDAVKNEALGNTYQMLSTVIQRYCDALKTGNKEAISHTRGQMLVALNETIYKQSGGKNVVFIPSNNAGQN